MFADESESLMKISQGSLETVVVRTHLGQFETRTQIIRNAIKSTKRV